jgi:hypothetical protein
MQTEYRSRNSGFGQILLAAATLLGLLLFVQAPRVQANESECQHRISKADHRLHEAIEHHGWNSPQAEHARHELHEAREYCWSSHHRWWDEDDRRWHTDRDWDEEHGRPH